MGRRIRIAVLLTALAALGVGVAGGLGAFAATSTPDAGDVGLADCGPGSATETGLQGQVPLADQVDGRSRHPYSCNLELVGHSPLSGNLTSMSATFVGNCAYLTTANANLVDSGFGGGPVNSALRGEVLVQDFSDMSDPKTTTMLSTPAMEDPWESLKTSSTGLVGAVGIQGPSFDLYDASKDCAHPTLDANIDLPDGYGHSGSFSPDGRFYYATDPPGLTGQEPHPERMQIVDVSDPTHPKLVLSWVPPTDMYIHDVAISPDGKTAYLAINGVGVAGSTGHDPVGDGRNGLLIVDTSQVQAGVPNPQLKVIGQVHWNDDTGADQMPVLARIGGKPYVIVTDEGGNEDFATATSCPLPDPIGYPRIISLANPADPTIVGTLRLQAQDPANCEAVLKDHTPYSSHYCSVDNPQNTTAIACTYWGSGLRVFDIRDPAHPREIAYYNPPNTAANALDISLSPVRFDTATNELWFSNELNGVQIVKFTNGVYPFAPAASIPTKSTPKRKRKAKHSCAAERHRKGHRRLRRCAAAGRRRTTP